MWPQCLGELDGHREEAQRALTAGVAAARAGGVQVMPVVYGLGHLAGLHADQRDWRSAEEVAAEALDVAAEHDVTEHWVCGMSHLVQGRALSASGDLPAAQSTLVRGAELAQRGAGPLDAAWGTLTLAGVLPALGDEPGARAALAQARSTLESCPDPGPVLHDLLAVTTRRVGTGSSRSGRPAPDRTGRDRAAQRPRPRCPTTPGDTAVPARNRRRTAPLAQHRQNPHPPDLPQASRHHPRPSSPTAHEHNLL